MSIRQAHDQQRYLSGEDSMPSPSFRQLLSERAKDFIYSVDEFVPVVTTWRGVARALHLIDENPYVGDIQERNLDID